MTALKAIDTLYKGYRFRSRLEARWAVFFDRCDMKYVYEHEGFQLPSGPYLPDFNFPTINSFLEVKPSSMLPRNHFEFQHVGSWPIRDDLPREVVLMSELYASLEKRRGFCVIVYGDPLDIINFIFYGDSEGGVIGFEGQNGPRVGSVGFYNGMFWSAGGPVAEKAADAARAARFEHGENRR